MSNSTDESARFVDANADATRRDFLKDGLAVACAAGLGLSGVSLPSAHAQSPAFTEWGWPTPYRKVSQKSVDWLKSKGWWPLKIAWNPHWSDGNVVVYVMKLKKFMEARGIEVEYPTFYAAGFMNEVYIPGQIQIAQAGSLGLLRIIDLKIPTAAVLAYSGQRQAFLVPPNSPLKSMSDLKGGKVLGRPAEIGITFTSTTHMGLLIAAKVLGLQEGKDFVIKNMGPADILTMPKGIDVTAMWEPNVIFMTEFRKNARVLEPVDTYEIHNGYSYVRGELEQNAPDVVQAYVDAFIEARLYARLRQKEVLSALSADETQRGRDPGLIARDAEIHVFNPKPTLNYPFIDTKGFWATLETFQVGVMADAGVLQRKYSEAEFKSVLRPSYISDTYARLGWAVPKLPAFVPADWKGEAGKPPYPPYGVSVMGPQKFPEPGDLTKEWTFAGHVYRP